MSHRREIIQASVKAGENKIRRDRDELHSGNPSSTRAQILRKALVHENKYLTRECRELAEA